jgi:Ni,Fe-hydrogenase maturation factor
MHWKYINITIHAVYFMKIFVFGNEYMENDSSAKKLADEIKMKGVEFIDCKSVSDLFDSGEKDPVILDVVENIKEPILIDNIDQLAETKSVSVHDMDLAFHLKLYKELGTIDSVKIIGVPPRDVDKNMKKSVEDMIKSF